MIKVIYSSYFFLWPGQENQIWFWWRHVRIKGILDSAQEETWVEVCVSLDIIGNQDFYFFHMDTLTFNDSIIL